MEQTTLRAIKRKFNWPGSYRLSFARPLQKGKRGKVMAKKMILVTLPGILIMGLAVAPRPIRVAPIYFMPILAAQEKGFWRERNLEAEWFPFGSGGAMYTALAAGSIHIGVGQVSDVIIAASRGIPTAVVADLGGFQDWYLYVRTDSPIKQPEDVKGKKIGIPRLGSLSHVYMLTIAKALGLERDVKVVATGGVRESVAALLAGAIDGQVTTPGTMINLELEGKVRRVSGVRLADFIPRDWDAVAVFATKGFIENNRSVVETLVRGVLRATEFIMEDPHWSRERMKAIMRWSDQVAREYYKFLEYSKDGKIRPERLKKFRDFLIDYGIISKEKTPPVPELYTARFVPVE